MRRLAALLALLALAACGGGESAEDVLSETATNLGEIRSGDLAMELVFTGGGGERTGFALEGPFALGDGKLPVARLDYTQIVGEEQDTVTFLSTGDQAFVSVAGTTYELPPDLSEQIASAAGELESEGGLERIEIGSWIDDPEVADGGMVGGAETDKVTASLDVAEVVNGLAGIASEFSGTEPGTRIEGDAAESLRRAVKSSSLELFTGKDDRLLRRLSLAIDFDADAPAAVKSLVGAGIRFELAISEPNKDVSVAAPEDARPASELFGE